MNLQIDKFTLAIKSIFWDFFDLIKWQNPKTKKKMLVCIYGNVDGDIDTDI